MAALTLSSPELVWPAGAILGEGPVWDAKAEALFWLDIKGQRLHRFKPSSGAMDSWNCDEPVGCITTPDPDGSILAASRSGFARIVLGDDGQARRTSLASPEASSLPGNRFNDGELAPDGSFWAGTMDDAEEVDTGAWWRFDAGSATATRLETGYRVTNGPAFDAERSRVYLTDSARQTVFVADWIDGGGFENKRVFLQFQDGDGYPDGMRVFEDGSLWIAFWDGACVRRFSPQAELLQVIDLPMQRPTSLAFAPALKSIFITSASIGLEPDGVQGALAQIAWR